MQIKFLSIKQFFNNCTPVGLLIFPLLFNSALCFSHPSDRSNGVTSFNDSTGIAEIYLELEKGLNPKLNKDLYLRKIDSLAEKILCEMGNARSIEDSISIINQFFYAQKLNRFIYEQIFTYNKDSGFLSDIFENNSGNCTSFSVLYFDLAERLGIKNIYAVMLPKHIFLRYELNGKKINIETTQKGKDFPDQWYLKSLNLSDDFLNSRSYFRNLTRKEFISILLCTRGNEYLTNGQIKKALKDYSEANELFPSGETYFGLAHCYSNLGDINKAIKAYNNSIQANPEHLNAYCNRGLLLEQTGKIEMALNDYNIALQLKPDFAEVYYNRGNAFTRKKDFSQAIKDFTTALEIKSNYVDAYFNRGCAKMLAGDYSGAIQDFNRTIESGRKTANTYIYRGDCKNSIGDKQGACEDWKTGFEMGYKFNKKKTLKYCKK